MKNFVTCLGSSRDKSSNLFRPLYFLTQYILVGLVLVGCCSRQLASYAVVREAQFRSEWSKADRIKVPLSDDSVAQINTFLTAGGIHPPSGEVAVVRDPGAAARYEPLLNVLRNSNLSLSDISDGQVLAKWLKYPALRQVIDAREERPIFPRPIALKDGSYLWIFYPDKASHIGHLLIVKSQSDTPER